MFLIPPVHAEVKALTFLLFLVKRSVFTYLQTIIFQSYLLLPAKVLQMSIVYANQSKIF